VGHGDRDAASLGGVSMRWRARVSHPPSPGGPHRLRPGLGYRLPLPSSPTIPFDLGLRGRKVAGRGRRITTLRRCTHGMLYPPMLEPIHWPPLLLPGWQDLAGNSYIDHGCLGAGEAKGERMDLALPWDRKRWRPVWSRASFWGECRSPPHILPLAIWVHQSCAWALAIRRGEGSR
jgi:hypothetical protein